MSTRRRTFCCRSCGGTVLVEKDRQWRDILGIVLVQGDRLDEDYLRDGARLLNVTELLDRALRVQKR